jgi:hypothetical protein
MRSPVPRVECTQSLVMKQRQELYGHFNLQFGSQFQIEGCFDFDE